MNSKTVLILEDEEPQRLALHEALRMRGFRVESAGNVATARAIARELGDELDVLVLDMRLEDPDEPNMTGADFGIEILEGLPHWPPEFLIISAYAEVDYYRLALRLGVAAYLQKSEHTLHQVIRHIRALTLRRALSVEQPNAAEQIRRIAETSQDRSEATVRFCREVLAPEFSSSLGAPFILLLTDDEGTQCCGGNAGLPEGFEHVYETLQALAQGELNRTSPFVLDSVNLKVADDVRSQGILAKLDGAAFLPLSISRNLRLSVGILQADREQAPLAENAVELAKILGHYFRSAVLEHLLNILSQWAEFSARRKAVLSATSRFCLYVGQEQLAILSDMADSEEVPLNSASFRNLQALAEDLRDTGQILLPLGGDEAPANSDNVRVEQHGSPVRMAEIVRSAWEDLDDLIQKKEITIEVDGDCEVQATRDDLLIATSRLLQWLADRLIETSVDVPPSIRVGCAETPDGPRLVFEDQSRRLGEHLRRRLFLPFSQVVALPPAGKEIKGPGLHLPLYLAKALVEVKNGGILEDRSDDLEGRIGHRFVMRFPALRSIVN